MGYQLGFLTIVLVSIGCKTNTVTLLYRNQGSGIKWAFADDIDIVINSTDNFKYG